MKTIGITGGTGLVGVHVASLLIAKSYNVVLFSRNPKLRAPLSGCTMAHWDPSTQVCDVEAIRSLDGVIHLAGEPVAGKRWTDAQKKRIVESRVEGTRFLVSQLRLHGANCRTFIGASATGFYGPDDVETEAFREDANACEDFLGTTCRQWEQEEHAATELMRTVTLRLGIVLAREGGAFAEFVKPFSFGIRPVLGSGKQVISWIHVADLAQMIVFALERSDINGVYNAVAPNPVSNRGLMKTIGNLRGGFQIPISVPTFALKVLLGEMSIEVLKSCTVSCEKIQAAGFKFAYPEISEAVESLLSV